MKEGSNPEFPEKTPDDELKKNARTFKPKLRLKLAL